jgi:SAM-dependent methyltransferase
VNPLDKQRIIDRYNARLARFGTTIEALASGVEERRQLRFSVLTKVGVGAGDRLLDLGCGFGDYSAYLETHRSGVLYTGIDINPNLIAAARERYPHVSFQVGDVQEQSPGVFDYVVSTSCFNLRLRNEDNYAYVAQLLRTCYDMACKGVAIDFLSSYVDFKGDAQEAFYYEPERVFAIAKSITKCVCLRHDYPLFEFCIYLYPDFAGWTA